MAFKVTAVRGTSHFRSAINRTGKMVPRNWILTSNDAIGMFLILVFMASISFRSTPPGGKKEIGDMETERDRWNRRS